MQTRVHKTALGWEGNTEITLGFVGPQREQILDIRTYRNHRGKLLSTASVSHGDGHGMKTHHIGVTYKADFFDVVLETEPSRITEKALKQQHAKAVAMVDSIKEQVRAHYQPKPLQTAEVATASHDVSH